MHPPQPRHPNAAPTETPVARIPNPFLEDVTANLFDDSEEPSSDSIDAVQSNDDDDEFLQSLRHHKRERQQEQWTSPPACETVQVPETPLYSERAESADGWPQSWTDELPQMRAAMEEKHHQLAKVQQRLNDIQSIDMDHSPPPRQQRNRRRADPKPAPDPSDKQVTRRPKGKETVESSIQRALLGSAPSVKQGDKVYVIHTAASGAYQYKEATVAAVDKEQISVASVSHPNLPLYATGPLDLHEGAQGDMRARRPQRKQRR